MHAILFEDGLVGGLGPVAAARPACDLSIGSLSLVEAVGGFGEVTRVVRPHLARHLSRLAGHRIPMWGTGPSGPTQPHVASRHGAIVLLANARLVPCRDTLAALRCLVEAGHEGAVGMGDTVLAAMVRVPEGDAGTREILRRLSDASDAVAAILEMAGRELDPPATGSLRLLARPHELLDAHERELESNLAMRLDSGRFLRLREGLYAAEGAEIVEPVVVRAGPVLVDTAARVGPFVCVDGPVWIGPSTRVNPHAWLRQGTAAGRDCRLGGEVEASVLEPFSNKPHDGFLGHSHVGSWANLAAGTITSNLKASYGSVRMRASGTDGIETGRQFVGAFLGELVRTAIHTSIQCGTQIGTAATVSGSVAGTVAPFSTTLHGPSTSTTAVQAASVLERMMARRGIAFSEADLGLLEDLSGGRSGL